METKTKEEYARARDRLTRYLALRDHSRFELRQKLLRRFSTTVVDRVLDEASNCGWLASDEAVAEQAVRMLERKGKSRRYIEGALRQKRLPLPPRDDAAEVRKVRDLVEKKFGSVAELTFEQKGKAVRFLKYRGFEDRCIRQVLNEKS